MNLVCRTEGSKSEREKQILHINTYVWNLKKKKWYRGSYLQGRNRDADAENGVWTRGQREGETNWEIGLDIYPRPCVS